MKVDTSRKAKIVVVCGSSGSGKSAWVKRQIKTAHRLIVWDVDDEYESINGIVRVTKISELAAKVKACKRGKFRYVGKPSDFDMWSRIAFAWGECVAVAEELAGVTSPGKAPPGWHTLVSRGRKRGMDLYGVTQRPSESDKTIMGNATLFHVGRLARNQDRKYMASELDVQISELTKLKNLEYVEKDASQDDFTTGKLRF